MHEQTPDTQLTYEVPNYESGDIFLRSLGSVSAPQLCVQEPGLLLVMHSRPKPVFGKPVNIMAVPYEQGTFRRILERLYQHRSLAFLHGRISTAVFNIRPVTVNSGGSENSAIVYNCKSDTASPAKPDDVAMSVTHLPSQRMTYAMMYGCTPQVIKLVSAWLKVFKGQALHPLIMPLVFAELERKRLFNVLDREQMELRQWILTLEDKLRLESELPKPDTEEVELVAQSRDTQSTKLWLDVSILKNGLESLHDQVVKMIEQSEILATTVFKQPAQGSQDIDHHTEERKTGERIKTRLSEMIAEFDSKVRTCDSLLGGMALAAQMESNYYTRRDAKVAIAIAFATKKDGSQMKSISHLGMIFLPGTFLASIFSMSFFNWTPPDSSQIISPWVAIYFAMALVVTVLTVWRMREWMKKDELRAMKQFLKDIGDVESQPTRDL
ncbi:hypothetical protein CTAM01_14442 [Colletotrichum tamarilloi]|uniref:CorA-like Mg2+ transporter n=1 Tax=Colletotrichum tamarilloi TaxID=1209934 RepID=A0ABQ9QPA8_9PEZI|nr:uncharacterized protein CTAM01_14442 [Colletotrichum tamarilloi]KAK1480395.1 hypothetical protein CTAM01_14442 [Colletotrichum tamarilloi]